jgi:uncharacterized membrane protein HdeD (DUF308 family)
MDTALKRSARYLALAGVAAIVFGVIVLVWPGISLVALTALFGAFAFVYGAVAVAGGLNLLAHKSNDWVPFVLGGLIGVGIGAVTFFSPGITVLALVYFIAFWAIMTGVFEIVVAIDLHGEVSGATWIGVSGAVSILFGSIVAIWPGSGALAILWMIGVYAILGGIARLIAAYRIHEFRSTATTVVGALRPQT